MYDGPIIDAHHHFWDLSMGKHPWLTNTSDGIDALGSLEKIRHDFMVEQFLDVIGDTPIVASVHIEALWDANDTLGETAWLDTLDKSSGLATRYVGNAALGTKDAADLLKAQAENPRMTGIRGILSNHPTLDLSFAPDPYLGYDPAWRSDVATIHALGLNLELMVYSYQAGIVQDLAHSFPDMTIVINHCASPIDRDAAGMARWRAALATMASCENVVIKTSNASHYDPDWSEESLAAIVHDCLAVFGAHRCIFGTDYPVSSLKLDYPTIMDFAMRATQHLSASEQSAYFHDNAKRVYKFD
ncbi:amidohydrolase family protein [Maritalea sp.]|uniref:amidohydrolase family protein n=1 Tax=Maritalea sp. TaxID=2003361 RepID=UPI003EF2B9B4